MLRLRRPALTPRLHHIGVERQRAGRACSRRSLGDVRRRGAVERHAERRKRIALRRGGRASCAGGGQRRCTPRATPRAAPCSGTATEICAQVARAGGAACLAGVKDATRAGKECGGCGGSYANAAREFLFLPHCGGNPLTGVTRPPRHEPGTGREQSRNTPLRG